MADKKMEAQISVEFEEATSRQSLNSGETINTLWGKVKRWLSDLKSVCFSGSYNDLSDRPTTATTDTDGLMSAEDKSKLDGIATGANKTVVDSALSSTSINPVQNKVVNSALAGKAASSHTHSDYALKTIYGNTFISLGRKTDTAVGGYSVAEGQLTTASGLGSHAEGGFTIASEDGAHAEGWLSTASGHDAHAEGYETTASGSNSHSEGRKTVASGMFSHAEGDGTTADGESSHAEGSYTTASGVFSHAGGKHTKALHDSEVAYGKYNVSNDDTLFSIGDGTSDSARHNAFEITTTGGKLHDKEIATTDMSLKANGGNADTVDGKHASDFKAYQEYAPIYTGDLLDITEMGTYSCSQGDCTNLPSEIASWCYVTMTGFRDAGYRQFVCSPFNTINSSNHSLYLANEVFKDSNGNLIWDKFYSDRYKPYVTGSATVAANSQICVTNHGFIPSAVIWWESAGLSGVAPSFNDSQFIINVISTDEITINYLMFK